MASIIVNGNPVPLSSIQPSENARFTNYLFIKGNRPITTADKRRLRDLDCTVYEYMGENVYLCRYEPADLSAIQNLDFIEAASVYPKRVKLTDFLKKATDPQTGDSSASTFEVEVVLHKGDIDVDQVVNEIAANTNIQPEDISVDHNKIRLTVDATSIAAIEKIDAVKAIEERIHHTVVNNLARADLDIDFINSDGVSTTRITYEGQNQVVAVSDTGFDKGSATDPHPAFTGRVAALIPVGRPKTGQTNDFNGHGTHVAGSVLGDGTSETMGGRIRGSAPKASLVLQALLDEQGSFNLPQNHWDLFTVPYDQHKARISTNSWGQNWRVQPYQIPYNSEAGALDRFVWHRQDHVILFAAGNAGIERSSTRAHITSSAAAKNCITVGATYSRRPTDGSFAYDPEKPPSDPSKMAEFSSYGPTIEQRMKPDVVAPGVAILSTSSRDPAVTDKTRFGPTEDELWQFDSGTSMATPLVAGCCALLREALQAAGTPSSSAALIKALLINGAVDLKLDRKQQGFGRVDISNSLTTVESHHQGNGVHQSVHGYVDVGFPDKASRLEEGQTWTTEVTLPSDFAADKVFKITMAYSDRYGPALQNKLSLRVKFISEEAASAVEKRGDEVYQGLKENNVEQVALKLHGTGYDKATITVSADRIARLDDTQGFAIVWGSYDG